VWFSFDEVLFFIDRVYAGILKPMNSPHPEFQRFVIVPKKPQGRRWAWIIVLLWPLSLLGMWWLTSEVLMKGGVSTIADDASINKPIQQGDVESSEELKQLRQALATAKRSDQINRNANLELQSTLSDREEEVAGLRTDVAFYERLVGATAQRRGLSVHAIRFQPEVGGTWQFTATLTQNLNRGAISQGNMKFSVEGISGGKLKSLRWEDLVQKTEINGKAYSFRYFQEVQGSVLLPSGFTPQRVTVSLRGNSGSADQVFPWTSQK
jgi:hypothetical protein